MKMRAQEDRMRALGLLEPMSALALGKNGFANITKIVFRSVKQLFKFAKNDFSSLPNVLKNLENGLENPLNGFSNLPYGFFQIC